MAAFFILLWFPSCCLGQSSEVYRDDRVGDLIFLGSGAGLSVLGHLLEGKQAALGRSTLAQLNRQDVNGFDRHATYNWSPGASRASDILLLGSGAVSLGTMLAVRNIRRDWARTCIMGLETFLINDGLTFVTKVAVGRIRPFAYNPAVPVEEKLTANARQAFFSGHASYSAAAAFFGAKVFHDHHPNDPRRWIVWGSAGLLSGSVAWLRVRAGKHYPSDVLVGWVMGAATGILIPAFYRKKKRAEPQGAHWEMGPAVGLAGWRLACRF